MSEYYNEVESFFAEHDKLTTADHYGISMETLNRYLRKAKQKKREKENPTKIKKNILVIPDLHAPFIRDGFLEFCKSMKKKWKCSEVIFLGDLVDNHYSSYFDSDPDGLSAIEELNRAIKQIEGFYKSFPDATVLIGNHDAIPNRKAFSSGVSSKWIKTIGEVLGVPNWNFKESHYDNGIMYCHGLGRKAHTRMKQDMISVVQGHYHSESYITWQVGSDRKTFAMQLGCGMDNNTYAGAYAKHFMRQHVNVGIILNGEVPIIEYMEL